jgi:galactokinase
MASTDVAVIRDRFRATFGRDAAVIASAPGRVNLIGEHTDYNEGFVLPMAIDRRTVVAVAPRDSADVYAASAQFPDARLVCRQPRASAEETHWSDYVGAVLWALERDGHDLSGFDILVSSDVPVAAGLSSSAAFELAVARAVCEACSIPWDARAMAVLGQRAENEFVGVRCGVMDQMAASVSRAGMATLLDCRSLATAFVAIPSDLAVVVMDSGVRRSLSGSEFNERRAACERATDAIRATYPSVRALRDVTPQMLDNVGNELDATTLRRARHVVAENERPAAMVRAFEQHDLPTAGGLLNDSHASLRDLYEVSSNHLDIICDEARAHAACYGARLTGAGFGGCAIAFVDTTVAPEFIAAVQPRYESRTYKKSEFFVALPSQGATVDVPRP